MILVRMVLQEIRVIELKYGHYNVESSIFIDQDLRQ